MVSIVWLPPLLMVGLIVYRGIQLVMLKIDNHRLERAIEEVTAETERLKADIEREFR